MSFLKKLQSGKKAAPAEPVSAVEAAKLKKDIELLRMQNTLYGIVVERYKKFIEDGESKSISELRLLIRPMDSAITEMKILIEDQFHPYVYETNFLLATQKAMDLIFSWKKVKLPISFWLSFSDMAAMKAADDMDQAIFLCSLFRSLGSESSRVLIGKDKSAWATFEFSEKTYVVNIAKKTMSAYAKGDDNFKQFMYQVQYAFNDKEYEDFSEEG